MQKKIICRSHLVAPSICMEKKCVLFISFISVNMYGKEVCFVYLFHLFVYLFHFVSTLSSLGRNHVGLLFSNEEQKMAGP